jgi:hypothetical protein
VKVDVFMLEFREQGGMFMPKDPKLHQLAVQFAAKNVAQEVNFAYFRNVWVAAEVDKEGLPVRILGLLGMRVKADFPLCRFTDNAAVVKLVQRARAYLQDSCRDWTSRGDEAFIYINEKEDESQRCPKWKKWLRVFKAEPAERWRLTI